MTDGLRSYVTAVGALGLKPIHRPGVMRENKQAENSHLPIRKRERQMQKFKSQASTQSFLSVHAAVFNTFYSQRHLTSRKTLKAFRKAAHGAWNEAVA